MKTVASKPILVVGSINLDLVISVKKLPAVGETVTGHDFGTFYGGKGANQAVAVARLGRPVSMIGRVGNDDFGRRLRQALRTSGVETAAVRVAPKAPSGTALITVESGGSNSIAIFAGANGELKPKDIERELALVRSAGLILAQLEIPVETVDCLASVAMRHGIPLVLDPAPARPLPARLLKKVAWLTPNETETGALCGGADGAITPANAKDYAGKLLDAGAQNVVIKLGSRGAYWAGNGSSAYVPAFRVRAVDSTAAGDAFNAGLAVSLIKGSGPAEAVRFGSAAAAISVTRAGAQPSMPTAQAVRRFLDASSRSNARH